MPLVEANESLQFFIGGCESSTQVHNHRPSCCWIEHGKAGSLWMGLLCAMALQS